MHLETLSSAGMLAIITVGAPGTHGALVTGMHGIGVSTPSAAAVAAATIGLAGELQTPNGMMFTSGTWSMMLAAGGPSHSTLFLGRTTSDDGAAPKVQVIIAPIETWFGMVFIPGESPKWASL
jgi:hypothetical protein